MTGYLLDTNVISMLSPSRTDTSARFLDWLERMDGDGRVFLSVVSVHEVRKGIALTESRGNVAKAAALRVWLDGLMITFDGKIIGVDAASAALAGDLEAKAIAAGHHPGMADATIAGIARQHELVIVTGNLKHFLPFGVETCSPDDVPGKPVQTQAPA